MLAQERQLAIRAQLQAKGRVVASDLAKVYGVSEDAIRRDLRELTRQGICRRIYGGALLHAPDVGDIGHRQKAAVDDKRGLAGVTAALFRDGQSMFIDSSSTNIAIAREIPRSLKLTVFTNAPAVAIELADHKLCRVIMLGGVFNAEKGACLGVQTVREAANIHADLYVLGACGLDLDAGITALDPDEAEVKRCFLAQSSQVVVALTSDKIGTAAPYKLAEASAIDTLILESGVDTDVVDAYLARGIEVHRVPLSR